MKLWDRMAYVEIDFDYAQGNFVCERGYAHTMNGRTFERMSTTEVKKTIKDLLKAGYEPNSEGLTIGNNTPNGGVYYELIEGKFKRIKNPMNDNKYDKYQKLIEL